jgi:hypothetical protein
MIRNYGIIGLGIVMGLTAGVANARAEEETPEIQEEPHFRPFTLSLEAGTTGLGGAVHWRFMNYLGIGAGFSGLSLGMGEVEGEGTQFDADLRLQVAPITVDFYPFKKKSFRISAGIAFNGNEITSNTTYTEDQEIGDGVYTPDQIGTLSLDAELGNTVVPYLGVGGTLFYFDEAHRWSLGWELGVLFSGSPDVSLRSSASTPGLEADLEKERQSLEDDLDALTIYPVAKIAISFAF